MRIIFVADVFVEDGILGGGELNNDEFINLVSKQNIDIEKISSALVTPEYIEQNLDARFLVANFIGLSEECKTVLASRAKYGIYEHDHKYLITRNPSNYENFIAPEAHLTNIEFYKNATAVFCQSKLHSEIVEKNLKTNNIINLGGNLWSEDALEIIEEISKKKKQKKYSILDSSIEHKNTADALRYCRAKNLDYQLIKSNNYGVFLNMLGSNEAFVFFPKTAETLSRVLVEARMMGCKTITSGPIGALSEEWFKLKGQELIDYMRDKKQKIVEIVMINLE
tara:strand:- start:997 stop:1839 length:843 start_codon:yes stop_codon:yes gene_type:complete